MKITYTYTNPQDIIIGFARTDNQKYTIRLEVTKGLVRMYFEDEKGYHLGKPKGYSTMDEVVSEIEKLG